MTLKDPVPVDEYHNLGIWQRFWYSLRHHPRRVAEVTLLLLMILVEWMGITIIAPLTPWFIEKLSPHMDEGAAASIMIASYAAGTTLGSLVSGPISDRVGRRPVFLVGLMLYATSYFLAANAWNLISFACFRALGGVAAGNRPVFIAFLVDTSDPRDLTFCGALLSISVNVGICIGPMIGGALALVKLEFPLYLFGGISSIVLVLLFFTLRESHHNRFTNATTNASMADSTTYERRQQVPPNKWLMPTITLLALIAFCAQYMLTGWSTVFGLLGAERYGLNSAENGLAFGVQGCVMILLCICYIPITKHLLSPALTAAVGLAVSSLLIIVPFLHSIYWTTAIGTVAGVGCFLFFSGIAYFINIVSSGGRRGLRGSLVMTSSNAGAVCGPIISGVLYDADPGKRAYPFYASLVVSILAALCCGIVDRGIKYTLRLVERARPGT
ncbi:hypothetical protein FOZ63_002580 [Perkinsus olseni]|uniref:Major facilitator superfamily (MFS) profile domain-containing protein n=1 Tax=Perkinsus olseni TaxID=32597 RepID=A0A7J6RXA2_PEROL|nr:hypothetical protein FOZ63_002580 [Perkinsus olseni]KAF4753149.1 hypothetical protein FOZ62_001073 [Perkinsus olseni]